MQAMQLKITLKYSRPPIWRRVLVDPDVTFWDLHSIIQDIFGWEDCHLHNFERAWKRNEDRHTFEVPHEDNLRDFMSAARIPGVPHDYYYDERKEKLFDWLTKEHPVFWYTYDFGDNWEHVIAFEKYIDVPKFKHAKYVKGKRRGVEEDSRSESLLDCTTLITAKDDPSSGLWQDIVEGLGKAGAEKLVAKARKEAVSEAPKHVRFWDSKERYKEAVAMGMFDE